MLETRIPAMEVSGYDSIKDEQTFLYDTEI